MAIGYTLQFYKALKDTLMPTQEIQVYITLEGQEVFTNRQGELY